MTTSNTRLARLGPSVGRGHRAGALVAPQMRGVKVTWPTPLRKALIGAYVSAWRAPGGPQDGAEPGGDADVPAGASRVEKRRCRTAQALICGVPPVLPPLPAGPARQGRPGGVGPRRRQPGHLQRRRARQRRGERQPRGPGPPTTPRPSGHTVPLPRAQLQQAAGPLRAVQSAPAVRPSPPRVASPRVRQRCA